jgi:hypothetical protein
MTKKTPTVHLAPEGYKTRMFDKWVCGRPAFVQDQGTTNIKEVTCPDCKCPNQSYFITAEPPKFGDKLHLREDNIERRIS